VEGCSTYYFIVSLPSLIPPPPPAGFSKSRGTFGSRKVLAFEIRTKEVGPPLFVPRRHTESSPLNFVKVDNCPSIDSPPSDGSSIEGTILIFPLADLDHQQSLFPRLSM